MSWDDGVQKSRRPSCRPLFAASRRHRVAAVASPACLVHTHTTPQNRIIKFGPRSGVIYSKEKKKNRQQNYGNEAVCYSQKEERKKIPSATFGYPRAPHYPTASPSHIFQGLRQTCRASLIVKMRTFRSVSVFWTIHFFNFLSILSNKTKKEILDEIIGASSHEVPFHAVENHETATEFLSISNYDVVSSMRFPSRPTATSSSSSIFKHSLYSLPFHVRFVDKNRWRTGCDSCGFQAANPLPPNAEISQHAHTHTHGENTHRHTKEKKKKKTKKRTGMSYLIQEQSVTTDLTQLFSFLPTTKEKTKKKKK